VADAFLLTRATRPRPTGGVHRPPTVVERIEAPEKCEEIVEEPAARGRQGEKPPDRVIVRLLTCGPGALAAGESRGRLHLNGEVKLLWRFASCGHTEFSTETGPLKGACEGLTMRLVTINWARV